MIFGSGLTIIRFMKVIGIDLGGTKVAAGVVDSKGKILKELSVPTELGGGWLRLKKQLVEICQELKNSHKSISAVGIGSAGPLHAPSGVLLDPTNFGWTSPLKVNIASQLKSALRLPITLENDAAAAVLAEHWLGGATENTVVLTLGTGLGMGVVANGKLVRGGRELHPEGGHLLLRYGDQSAICGCGNAGCAEAYLSGKNFTTRVAKALGNPELKTLEILEMAKSGNSLVQEFLREYSELLAIYIQNLVVLYYPEKIILTGSFANAHELFLDETERILRGLLLRRLKTLPLQPKLQISRLGNKAGVLGAAYVALHKNYAR
ncbi:MAG: ROK family protein [Bdellovibrionota bacterium]